jgi:hypothetical protein
MGFFYMLWVKGNIVTMNIQAHIRWLELRLPVLWKTHVKYRLNEIDGAQSPSGCR